MFAALKVDDLPVSHLGSEREKGGGEEDGDGDGIFRI